MRWLRALGLLALGASASLASGTAVGSAAEADAPAEVLTFEQRVERLRVRAAQAEAIGAGASSPDRSARLAQWMNWPNWNNSWPKLAQLVGGSVDDVGTVRLVVLQPTPYCNIACDYCYLPDRNDRRVMAPDVLDAIGARVLGHPLVAGDCTVVWHAGEPLVLPAEWYRQAIDRLEMAAGRRFVHAIQTNGIGLDEAWLHLARERVLRIGLSLDGPAHLHDARRRTRKGRGTHALAMMAVQRLQQAGLTFHIITVLTRDHLDDPDGLFDFYVAHGLSDVGFNIEEIEGANTRSTLLDADLEDAFRLFFRRFLARVEGSNGAFRLREAMDAEAMLLHAPPGVLSEQARPLAIVSVDVTGRVSTFSPELLGQTAPAHGDFTFGTLLEEDFTTIAARMKASRLAEEIARGVQACRDTCAYHAFCGGGAPANKWAEHGRFDVAETRFCRLGRQVVLEEVLTMLEARFDRSGGPPLRAKAA